MSKAKNQHYVPQFYLRYFSPDGRSVFVFDKVVKKSFRPPISRIAAEKLFYELPSEVTPHTQAVEKTLSVIERDYARAIDHLLSEVRQTGRFTAGMSERNEIIAHFLLIQFARTRGFRDTHGSAMHQFSVEVAKKEEFVRNWLASQGSPVTSASGIIPAPPEMSSLAHAMYMFDGFVELVLPVLSGHLWLIAKNETSQPLFTSDAPVILNSEVCQAFNQGVGFTSPAIEILLPLSSRFALIMLDSRFYGPRIKETDGDLVRLTSPEGVMRLNRFQVINSYRQVYCQEDRFDLVEELIDICPELCNPARPRFRVNG